ncbi:hypothetical protein VPH35_051695 [Triticum aestivum]
MASSASPVPAGSVAALEDIAPLPLIRCPRCNMGSGHCTFWKGDNKYIDCLRARWAHVFLPPPPPLWDLPTVVLHDIQSDLKISLAIALRTLAAVLMLLVSKM